MEKYLSTAFSPSNLDYRKKLHPLSVPVQRSGLAAGGTCPLEPVLANFLVFELPIATFQPCSPFCF